MSPISKSLRKFGAMAALIVLWSMAFSACEATSQVRARVSSMLSTLDQAERNGARRCAPRELAIGRAEAHFASMELDEGDLGRATQHADQAQPNANAALRLSPPDRCLPRAPVAALPPRRANCRVVPRGGATCAKA